jgi:hypothetical protein
MSVSATITGASSGGFARRSDAAGRNPGGFAAFLGLDGGADADRGQAQALGQIARLSAALGQQAGRKLPRSQNAAMGGKDLH